MIGTKSKNKLEITWTLNKIKSVINRDGATCQNNNYFECPTILNAPWDEHSMMVFKSVAITDRHMGGRADGRYQTYYLPCFAVDEKVELKRLLRWSCLHVRNFAKHDYIKGKKTSTLQVVLPFRNRWWKKQKTKVEVKAMSR